MASELTLTGRRLKSTEKICNERVSGESLFFSGCEGESGGPSDGRPDRIRLRRVESTELTFPAVCEKITKYSPAYVEADAGYKTPPIAKLLIDGGVKPVFPYKRPMTAEGFFPKREYVYDEAKAPEFA